VAIRQLCLNKNQQISPQKLQEIIHASLGFLLKKLCFTSNCYISQNRKNASTKTTIFSPSNFEKISSIISSGLSNSHSRTLSYIKKGLLRPQELIDYVLRKHQEQIIFLYSATT